MTLQSINFLRLTVPEIQAGQTFPAARLPAHPDTMGENNTPTALKGCGVKIFKQNTLNAKVLKLQLIYSTVIL